MFKAQIAVSYIPMFENYGSSPKKIRKTAENYENCREIAEIAEKLQTTISPPLILS